MMIVLRSLLLALLGNSYALSRGKEESGRQNSDSVEHERMKIV